MVGTPGKGIEMATIDEMTPRQQQTVRDLLNMIRRCREESYACTAGEIARLLRQPKQSVVNRLNQARKLGLVNWSHVDGSIHLTASGGKLRSALNAPPPPSGG